MAVSHGDIIKSILADALGMHLDLFQRISVDPASVSIVRYTPHRPYVLATNTHEGDLAWLAPPKKRSGRRARPPVDARRRRGGPDHPGPGSGPPLGWTHGTLVHGFDPPERFVAGTVGPPGSRSSSRRAQARASSASRWSSRSRRWPSGSTSCSTR